MIFSDQNEQEVGVDENQPPPNDSQLLKTLQEANASFVKNSKSKNTIRKYDAQVNRFNEFLDSRGEQRSVQDLPRKMLEQYISFYIMELKQLKGGEYQITALNANISSLLCGLKERGVDCTGLKNVADMAAAKRKDLVAKGMGNRPNRADLVTWAMEEEMWRTGALGDQNPQVNN